MRFSTDTAIGEEVWMEKEPEPEVPAQEKKSKFGLRRLKMSFKQLFKPKEVHEEVYQPTPFSREFPLLSRQYSEESRKVESAKQMLVEELTAQMATLSIDELEALKSTISTYFKEYFLMIEFTKNCFGLKG